MNRLLLATFALALAPLASLADTAPAPAAAAPAIPPPDCHKPNLQGPQMTRDMGVHNLQAEAQAYLDCLKAYAEQEKGLAQTHGAAANKAINDYNAFVQEVNDFQNKPKN